MDPMRAEAEPEIPVSSGSGAARATLSALLVTMLVAAAWVRFNDRIAAISPGLAAPAAGVAEELANPGRVKGLLELGMAPVSAGPLAGAEAAAAAEAMGLPVDDAAALAREVQRGRLRLVRLPLYDAGPDAPGTDAGAGSLGGTSRSVQVSSGGYTRLVRLTRQPVVVTLPIGRVGTVSFMAAGVEAAGPVGVGALTLTGPVRLPDLAPGRVLDVGVVAQ